MSMDLQKQLLKEHSKANCILIVNWVGQNETRFAHLVGLFLQGPYRLTQRAAWPISYCAKTHPELMLTHLKKVVAFAANPMATVSTKRNVVRLLQFIEIPKVHYGRIAEMCFRFLADKKETVAVQVFSMTVLVAITQHQPALARELRLLLEERLPYATSGFKARARKVLMKLDSL